MHDVIDQCMRAYVRWPCPVDVGARHLVVCASASESALLTASVS